LPETPLPERALTKPPSRAPPLPASACSDYHPSLTRACAGTVDFKEFARFIASEDIKAFTEDQAKEEEAADSVKAKLRSVKGAPKAKQPPEQPGRRRQQV
jgi:hypothetical protein